MSSLPRPYQQFQDDFPDVFQAYEQLGKTAAESGPLGEITRELIKLGMAAALRGESAVKSHCHRALQAGATPQEIQHAVVIGVTTMGFPTMMSALTWVQQAIQESGD